MPYTPPAHSPSASPGTSRSSSFSHHDTQSGSTLNLLNKNNPPRSTTYLHKHRRNSSVSLQSAPVIPQCPARKVAEKSPATKGHQNSSDSRSLATTIAVMSPPDSNLNSDEEEDAVRRNLGPLVHELKEAFVNLPKGRSSSPDSSIPRSLPVTQHQVQARGRTMCHNRTQSHPTLLLDIGTRSRSGSNSSTDSIDEESNWRAPAMVRKKSGEVVKSSLKSPSRSRPCSMPSTPTFPKNVHFDSRIEHVRHFLHSEKPSAVSVGSSPVEGSYEELSEYPFSHDSDDEDWEIHLPNFPKNPDARKQLPVRLEKVCLSTDKKNLIGTVAVANIHFQKHVVARFTFDYWQTVSEVAADWSSDVRRRDREDGVDRFVFKIKLAEQAHLEKKTLFFCIRYCSGGQEHWDNNGGVNFQVDFRRTSRSHIGGPRLRDLPRSKPSASRPMSMPNMDEFGVLDDAFFARMKDMGLRETGDKLPKMKKHASAGEDSAMPARRVNPSGNAFGNRYDFRTSLSAAMKGSSSLSPPRRASPPKTPDVDHKPVDLSNINHSLVSRISSGQRPTTTPTDSPSFTGAGPPEIFNPENFWITEGDKPSIESPSYRELLDNYCFFGSSKATKLSKPEHEVEMVKESIQIVLPTGYASGVPSPSLSIAQHKSTGNASPIPLNYAGYHHRRRGSGAFRFDTTKTPTAIC